MVNARGGELPPLFKKLFYFFHMASIIRRLCLRLAFLKHFHGRFEGLTARRLWPGFFKTASQYYTSSAALLVSGMQKLLGSKDGGFFAGLVSSFYYMGVAKLVDAAVKG